MTDSEQLPNLIHVCINSEAKIFYSTDQTKSVVLSILYEVMTLLKGVEVTDRKHCHLITRVNYFIAKNTSLVIKCILAKLTALLWRVEVTASKQLPSYIHVCIYYEATVFIFQTNKFCCLIYP